MRKISLFAEDIGHEEFIKALCLRFARNHGVEIHIDPRSVRGGYGKVIKELTQFLQNYSRGNTPLPDLLIVATDANCKGYNKRKQQIDDALVSFSEVIPENIVVHAIPDPHVERWALLDSSAFKQVLGRGCQAPDQKCERDRYKALLAQAIRDAGVQPLIGGIEHFEDIVNIMDLSHVRSDKSLGNLLDRLDTIFTQWQQAQLDASK